MAVDIQTAADFKAGIPHELFKLFTGTTWNAAPDGERFLIEQSPGADQGTQMHLYWRHSNTVANIGWRSFAIIWDVER